MPDYVKRPRFSGIKIRTEDMLSAKIEHLNKVLNYQAKFRGQYLNKDDKVAVKKIQFMIEQAERKIAFLNRNSEEVVA